ncbi:TetR/AcrR family transcriptional regulator [Neobacillus sp. FSL H8-0543]|uniref:TetR/AcrR family transcriptional regulator n=1 Tax=Neobacillus sp. FSL H8-0543 TaxID=2954672 RepID=UPI0031581A96
MRQKIIETSIQLFDQNGFKSTSINDIVQLMGVTKGTFYYYFTSKEELLKDIQLTYIKDLIKQQEVILRCPKTNISSKLFEIIYMIMKNIKTQRQSARIFSREMRHLSIMNLEDIHKKRNLFRYNTQMLIEEGIKTGEFKANLRADIITFGILGSTNWSYYWFNTEGEVSEEKVAKIYLDMILNGIKESSLSSFKK